MQSDKNVEAFNSINHKLSQLSKIETKCFIYRVHEELRDVNNKAYEPNIVAIGPYHRGKDNLRMMEERKVHFLQLLLECQKQSVERYISAIGELEQKARDCYAEPISLNGAQFVEMLVLDGCFIIEFVRKYYSEEAARKNDPIFQTPWMINNLMRDLILFENQIPFFVLCKLFDLIEGEDQRHVLIDHLLRFCWMWGSFPGLSETSSPLSSEGIKHLLDLVYSNWISATDDIFLSIETVEPSIESNFIPTATKLKDANMEFCRKQGDILFEVKFENGKMEMPGLEFDDDTECFLRNLVVYEQYFLKGQRNPVTDYVVLLDCLINTSKDVEILSECKIISNWLGDNEKVANIINELADSIVCRGEHFVYAKMFKDVNKHYQKVWNRWVAMLRRDIFYSPWAYISFFAALAILVLTVVQAVCSIQQVV